MKVEQRGDKYVVGRDGTFFALTLPQVQEMYYLCQNILLDNALSIKKKGYVIHGSTGCTCCREYNFVDGIYLTEEEAKGARLNHIKNQTVSSQYSKTGRYSIQQIEYIELPDERVVIGDNILDNMSFFVTHGDDYYFEGPYIEV